MPIPVPPGWWSDRRGQDRVQWSLSALFYLSLSLLTQCWGWSRHYNKSLTRDTYPSPCDTYPSPCDTYPSPCDIYPSPWDTYPSPCDTYVSPWDTYPSPYTVSKHHKPPRRDGRSQVTAGQLRSDVSSAESSLSPHIKTDIVTLPLMYVNESLSAASPVAQFSYFHMRTGLRISHCTDVGVGFK